MKHRATLADCRCHRPFKLFVLLGFGLLFVQMLSEVIKRVAVLAGHLAEEDHEASNVATTLIEEAKE